MNGSELAIKVEGLGKRYELGTAGVRGSYRTLRESLTGLASSAFRRRPAVAAPAADREYWALRDVSFEVGRGEVVGVIGRNGAGKSTLLKVLSRITQPTTGSAEITGRVGSLLEVGTGFHPELSGRENIYLNGAILGMGRREIARKFDEIVAFAEIERFLDTPVKRYSSGMYMRLAFAVAAHLEPEILVVDEVLAVGDAEFQKKCLGKMQDVSRQGRTVLFVSHNMNAVEQLCSRALLLERGRLALDALDVREAVTRLLFGARGSGTASAWENPGGDFPNPYFAPDRFYLSDEVGQVVPAEQRGDADLWVNIDAEIEVVDPALTVGYAIFTEGGQLLYWSYQTDADPGHWPRLRAGRCTLRSRLPRRLFNEGTYRIELIGGLTHRNWLFEPGVNAPSITLTVQGGLSDSPLWTSRRDGLLAPALEWTTA